MQNLSASRDQIKATAALSNSAKLLAGYMKATGVSDAKTIADDLDIPLRTVQRLKLDIAVAGATCANDATRGVSENAKDATDGADKNANSANCAMDGVSEAPNAPPVAPPARVEENNLPTNLETSVGSLKTPPTPSHVQPVADWRSAFGADDNHGVTFVEGRLTLVNGTRAFWLERFGGDAIALDLALIEAAGSLQRGSNAGLKVQVERKLANIARDTRDRDKRYERATGKGKAPSGAQAAKSPMRALLERNKAGEARA